MDMAIPSNTKGRSPLEKKWQMDAYSIVKNGDLLHYLKAFYLRQNSSRDRIPSLRCKWIMTTYIRGIEQSSFPPSTL